MAATPSMKNRDGDSAFHIFAMFDEENEAKVDRPIGAIDHDGWGYITYGPHYDNYDASTQLVVVQLCRCCKQLRQYRECYKI